MTFQERMEDAGSCLDDFGESRGTPLHELSALKRFAMGLFLIETGLRRENVDNVAQGYLLLYDCSGEILAALAEKIIQARKDQGQAGRGSS